MFTAAKLLGPRKTVNFQDRLASSAYCASTSACVLNLPVFRTQVTIDSGEHALELMQFKSTQFIAVAINPMINVRSAAVRINPVTS